jgi:hypothetical protein
MCLSLKFQYLHPDEISIYVRFLFGQFEQKHDGTPNLF